VSLYERVGGEGYFHALVDRFYDAVEDDPVLRPIYPQHLEQGKANLAEFLIQYWGGPRSYSDRRGHPRLRMRHFPFAIGRQEREAWLHHMSAAVHDSQASPSDAGELIAYFETASTMLVNRADAPVCGEQPNEGRGNP
jgi:hemoglobin